MTGTAFDRKFRPLASGMLAKFGKSITYRRVTLGTGPQPTPTTADTAIKAVITGASLGHLPGGMTMTDGKKVLIAASDLTFAPSQNDKMVIDGVVQTIALVKPIYSGELVAAHEIYAGISAG